MNLGSNSRNLNRNNSYFILGLYSKVSILNFNKILINLKKKINFVIRYSKNLKNAKFFIINSNKNKILIKRYEFLCSSVFCSYYNGTWWNGLLKSFKKYTKYKSYKKNKKFKFFNNQYPSFSFYIHKYKRGEYSLKTSFINKEINSVSMLNLMFFSDHIDFDSNPSMILCNTSSFVNNLYLFNFSLKIVKNSLAIVKKEFFSILFSKYKILKFFKIKIFFEQIYCLKNKKNYFASRSWSDDLD